MTKDFTTLRDAQLKILIAIRDDINDMIAKTRLKNPKKFEEIALFLVEISCHINAYDMAAVAWERFKQEYKARKDTSTPLPNIHEMIMDEAVRIYSKSIEGENEKTKVQK